MGATGWLCRELVVILQARCLTEAIPASRICRWTRLREQPNSGLGRWQRLSRARSFWCSSTISAEAPDSSARAHRDCVAPSHSSRCVRSSGPGMPAPQGFPDAATSGLSTMVSTGYPRIFSECQWPHLSLKAVCAWSEFPPPVPGCVAVPGWYG